MASTEPNKHALVQLCVKNIAETRVLYEKSKSATQQQCHEMLNECVEMQIQFLHEMLCTPFRHNMCLPFNEHVPNPEQIREARQKFLQELT